MKKCIKVLAASLLLGTVLAGCDGTTSENSTSTSGSTSTSTPTPSTSTSVSASTSTSTSEPIVAGVSEKKSFTEFKANKAEKEEDHKTEEFFDRTQDYLVGDDNAFNIKPTVNFIDPITKLPVSGVAVTFNLSLYEYVNESAVKVDDITTYVEEFNNSTCDLKFKANAVGKKFKFDIVPDGVASDKVAQFTKSLDFKVVDGYNVYNPKELGYFNKRIDGDQDDWDAFMIANGYESKEVHSLIFHNNLEVTTADFPSIYLYKEGDPDLKASDSDYQRTLGSLRDYRNIYRYDFTSNDEKVAMYGNYFTLDCSKIPLVTREDSKITEEGRVISHASLIKTQTESAYEGQFTVRDLNLIGNAQRTEEAKKGGGLIFHKALNVKTQVENTISRCWFITYFAEFKEGQYTINKTKAYDSFNSFIYNWGSNVFINNSEMTGAGGPIIIQDHVEPTKGGLNIGRTTVDDNSHLENWVTGSEGWFSLVNATALVPSIVGLNTVFTPYSRTFLQKRIPNDETQFFNLVCVNKSGDAAAPTPGTVIKGSIKIGENSTPFDFGETNPTFAAYKAGIASVNAEAPVFQTSTNGMAFTDTQHLLTLDMSSGTPTPTAVKAGDSVLTGDHLAIYYGGMCFTLGYYGL